MQTKDSMEKALMEKASMERASTEEVTICTREREKVIAKADHSQRCRVRDVQFSTSLTQRCKQAGERRTKVKASSETMGRVSIIRAKAAFPDAVRFNGEILVGNRSQLLLPAVPGDSYKGDAYKPDGHRTEDKEEDERGEASFSLQSAGSQSEQPEHGAGPQRQISGLQAAIAKTGSSKIRTLGQAASMAGRE